MTTALVRPRLIRHSIASAVVIVGMGVIMIPAAVSAAAHHSARRGNEIRAPLTVVACPTTYGIAQARSPIVPERLAVSLPVQVAGELTFYSDKSRSIEPILGPKGWHCTAIVGADGSTAVSIAPPAERLPLRPTASLGVTAYSLSACQGCVYGLVCPFVPGAGQELGYAGVLPCTSAPRREAIDFLKGSPTNQTTPINDEIAFEDPAGVHGDGTPSGGVNAANGVVLYSFSPRSSGGEGGMASVETCTLPRREHAVCTAILDEFIASARTFVG